VCFHCEVVLVKGIVKEDTTPEAADVIIGLTVLCKTNIQIIALVVWERIVYIGRLYLCLILQHLSAADYLSAVIVYRV
jgi:hypothetical protein